MFVERHCVCIILILFMKPLSCRVEFFLTAPPYSYICQTAQVQKADGVWHIRDFGFSTPRNKQLQSIRQRVSHGFSTRERYSELMQKTKKYPINPPDDMGRRKKKMGQVIVIEDRCKGCGFCIANCPRQVLTVSSTFNKKGYHPPEVIDTTRCVNCHFCEILCPEFAIYSIEYNDLDE